MPEESKDVVINQKGFLKELTAQWEKQKKDVCNTEEERRGSTGRILVLVMLLGLALPPYESYG